MTAREIGAGASSSGFVDRLLSIGTDPGDDREQARLKRLVVGALWISLVPTAAHAVLMFVNGAAIAGVLSAGMGLTVVLVVAVLRRRPESWPGAFHLLIAANYTVVFSIVLLFGGHGPSGTNSIWGLLGALAALVVFSGRQIAALWLFVFVSLAFLTGLLATRVDARYELPNPELLSAFNISMVSTFVLAVLLYFIRQRTHLLRQSDDLLRNVLPDEIAERLKDTGGDISEYFAEASVLFADVVEFTPMAADMSPAETVHLLNEVFSAFDDLVGTAGLVKIKTIGDEYMVAAGVPRPRSDHATALADLALSMQEHVQRRLIAGRRLSIRVGINSGPVVAGVIGRERFAYDLWGAAVNTASRMESHGEPGKIQISEATYRLIRDEFTCEPQGEIDIKGMGSVPVWHLIGRR